MFSQGLPNHFKCFSENLVSFWGLTCLQCFDCHYVKSARIRSYSGPYFPAFGVSIRIQSECGKMRARITPNTDTFHTVSGIYFELRSGPPGKLFR